MILPNHALDCKREASSTNTILLSFLARAFSHILPENVLSLHPKGKSANMPGMKISRFMIAVAVGMAVVSCSSPSEFPNPDACDVAPDSAQPQNGEKGGKKNGDTTNKSNVDEQPSGGEDVTPSEEQQAAAEQMLSEMVTEESESLDVLPRPVGNEDVLDEAEPNAAGIPGRNALRMGQYAPPEEAVSSGDARPPRPNRVEQHGFRSPALPTKLPMDINGKLTGDGNN